MSFIRALLRLAGKTQGKVIAVFAVCASDAGQSVRYVRNGAPDVPVWLFSLETPARETSALCERVVVQNTSLRLFLTAQRLLWPRFVALSTAPWKGSPGHWAVKIAPFWIPPFRALLFNENGDSFAARPAAVLRHLRHRLLSDDALLDDEPRFIPSRAFRMLRRFSQWIRRSSSVRPQKLKPYDVLVFPVIDWDYRFQRPQQLTLELARRGHRVFYISTTFLPAFGLSEPRTRAVANNVYLVDLPGGEDPLDIYSDIPNELQLAALEFGLSCLKQKFALGATLSLVDYPFWAPLVRRLNNNIVLYDCMDDYRSFVVADIPGLIEGAAEGRGLGHDFLRHVERARVLCVLLDLSESAPLPPEEQLEVLLRELGDYRSDLLERPRVVVGSKGDVAAYEFEGVDTISAVTGEGLDVLVGQLARLVTEARDNEAEALEHEIVVHRPLPDEITLEREGEHGWIVEGRAARRAVRFQDLTDDEALAEIVHRLRELGVERLLTRAGVRDGDLVTIGALSFEWWRDGTSAGLDRGQHHRATRRERLARHGRLDLGDGNGDA